jgi:hypothetical protein
MRHIQSLVVVCLLAANISAQDAGRVSACADHIATEHIATHINAQGPLHLPSSMTWRSKGAPRRSKGAPGRSQQFRAPPVRSHAAPGHSRVHRPRDTCHFNKSWVSSPLGSPPGVRLHPRPRGRAEQTLWSLLCASTNVTPSAALSSAHSSASLKAPSSLLP